MADLPALERGTTEEQRARSRSNEAQVRQPATGTFAPSGPSTPAAPERIRSQTAFRERWDAGIGACIEGLLLGREDGNERTGLIFRVDSKFGYTIERAGAVVSDPLSIPVNALPKGAVWTGVFHTHPALSGKLGGVLGTLVDFLTAVFGPYSAADEHLETRLQKHRIAAYLGTPDNDVYERSVGNPYRFPREVVIKTLESYRGAGIWPVSTRLASTLRPGGQATP